MRGPDRAADLDARGQRCPQPVIALARLVRDLEPGADVLVLADDPAARHDIPAWARMRGHTVELHERERHTAYLVVLGEEIS